MKSDEQRPLTLTIIETGTQSAAAKGQSYSFQNIKMSPSRRLGLLTLFSILNWNENIIFLFLKYWTVPPGQPISGSHSLALTGILVTFGLPSERSSSSCFIDQSSVLSWLWYGKLRIIFWNKNIAFKILQLIPVEKAWGPFLESPDN